MTSSLWGVEKEGSLLRRTSRLCRQGAVKGEQVCLGSDSLGSDMPGPGTHQLPMPVQPEQQPTGTEEPFLLS
jgi:hypothetical protein